MVRRTPKPFVVEVRNGRRKQPSPMTIEAEHPRVEWQAAMLDALRGERAWNVPGKETGRVLPALPVADPVEIVEAEMVTAVSDPPQEQDDDGSPALIPEITSPEPAIQSRRPRDRRSRDDFSRAERRKARLPGTVHGFWWKLRG